jgi:hypothetical protein
MYFIPISLLHKYPELKTFYHIPEAYKTEADLLNADEVKEPGEQFISLYSDIIENSDTNFDEKLREKALELNKQGIRASQVKVTSKTALQKYFSPGFNSF